MESIELMFDKIGEQLRYAADAGNIIEACKYPERAARWLFGYGGDEE